MKGPRGTELLDHLTDAILAEWTRRWPNQKWWDEVEVEAKDGWASRRGPIKDAHREKARAAAEAMLDWYAYRG